jgi:hypothetical protein
LVDTPFGTIRQLNTALLAVTDEAVGKLADGLAVVTLEPLVKAVPVALAVPSAFVATTVKSYDWLGERLAMTSGTVNEPVVGPTRI